MTFFVDLRKMKYNQITIDLKQKYSHFQGFSLFCYARLRTIFKFNRNFCLTQLNFVFRIIYYANV